MATEADDAPKCVARDSVPRLKEFRYSQGSRKLRWRRHWSKLVTVAPVAVCAAALWHLAPLLLDTYDALGEHSPDVAKRWDRLSLFLALAGLVSAVYAICAAAFAFRSWVQDRGTRRQEQQSGDNVAAQPQDAPREVDDRLQRAAQAAWDACQVFAIADNTECGCLVLESFLRQAIVKARGAAKATKRLVDECRVLVDAIAENCSTWAIGKDIDAGAEKFPSELGPLRAGASAAKERLKSSVLHALAKEPPAEAIQAFIKEASDLLALVETLRRTAATTRSRHELSGEWMNQ